MLHVITQVDVRQNGTDPRGVVSFGLFWGDYSVQYNQPEIQDNLQGSYYICEFKISHMTIAWKNGENGRNHKLF